jgi:isoquinoline 1-oxidoreductase alpha subunit
MIKIGKTDTKLRYARWLDREIWTHFGAMTMVKLKVNGKQHSVDAAADTPLLWVIRENLGFTGTKFGCGVAQCGACVVHIDGKPVRSCITPVSRAEGAEITTIEGIAADGNLHPVQQAWITEQVPQCGYCQSGQIMSAVALLRDNPDPDDAEIDRAMSGNLCRCGMYARMKKAIKTVAGTDTGVQALDAGAGEEIQNG